jgi:hypothetical protein
MSRCEGRGSEAEATEIAMRPLSELDGTSSPLLGGVAESISGARDWSGSGGRLLHLADLGRTRLASY